MSDPNSNAEGEPSLTERDWAGDPLGRRLSRDQAARLSEAYAIARLLELLLVDTDVDTASCGQILEEIEKQERIALQRSQGRIEPRKRFKGHASQPLLDSRALNYLYVDEGGKSNPETVNVPTFFALGAVAIDDEEHERYCERADSIKQEFFGTTEVTFHEPELRMHKGRYYFNGNQSEQRRFDNSIERLIEEIDFTVFGVGIRKSAFRQHYAEADIDPYLPTDVYAIAIVLLLERYVDYIASTRPGRLGRVTFESQGPLEDALHQLEYARVLISGSQWLKPSSFRNWLETGLRFAPKRGSEATELADMVARSLYEWIRGGCEVNPSKWSQLSRKIYCRDDGQMGKFGIKVFPDSDILNQIHDHRREYAMGGGD